VSFEVDGSDFDFSKVTSIKTRFAGGSFALRDSMTQMFTPPRRALAAGFLRKMKKAYLSIDLGGTNLACAVADEAMQLLGQSSVPTESHLGPSGVIARIAELIETALREHGVEPLGVGVGVPGLVDVRSGTTLFLPNLPGEWRGVPVAEPLTRRFGCPVSVLNDARLATLGELHFGAGRSGASTFAFFTLGTGVGGGVVVDGRLRLGPLGAAGELGHQTIVPDGPLCGCGNRGCLETLISGPVLIGKGAWLVRCGRAPILRERIDGDLERLTPMDMVAAAEAGDEAVREVLVEAARFLGIGVANIVSVLHPDAVILGGGLARLGGLLLETVRATVKQRVGMFPPDDVRIELSALGDAAGVWGGLALARDPGPRMETKGHE